VIENSFYFSNKFVRCRIGEEATFPDRGRREDKDTTSMKTLLAGAVLAAALASPALARTSNHTIYPSTHYVANGRHEYIYPPDNHVHSANPANDVYDIRGRYIGSDPDPFIRDYLARGRSQD
jgi:hypothetical protein